MPGNRRLPVRQRWLSWYAGVGLLAFVGVTIGPSLIGRNTYLSVDRLTINWPWLATGTDVNGHQLCTTDTIDSQIPGTHYVLTSLAHGHLPNWQSLVAGGSPLASQPNLGLLNPISWPYFFMPLWLAPAFHQLLVFLVAIGGTYLFLRRLSVRKAAAIVAGVTFAASGFMVMWTNWPQTEVAAFIPVLFWATERLIQRARVTDVIPIAIAVASMLLGGFPAVTGWALYAAAAYLIVRVLARHDKRQAWRRVVIGTVGVVIGLLLAMVQMLPFVATYTSSDFGYREGLGHTPLPLSGLLTLFVPNANGLCLAGKQVYGRVNPVELIAYIGSAALVLIVVGALAKTRRDENRGVRGFFTLGTALIVFLGWGMTAVLDVVDNLPVFSGNPIGRIRSVLGFFFAVLVGLGFDALQRKVAERKAEPEAGRRHNVWWRAVVIVAVVGLAGGVAYAVNHDAHKLGYREVVLDRIKIPALLIAVALLCVALVYLRWKPTALLGLVVLPALVVAQGAVFMHRVIPGDSKANFYPVTPTHQFLEDNLGQDRYTATDGMLYPATSLYYGLRSATGHTFHEKQWVDLLSTLDSGVMQSPTHSDFSSTLTPTLAGQSQILDRMAVKYFVTTPDQLVGSFPALDLGNGAATTTTCTIPGGALRGVTTQLASTVLAADALGLTLHVTVSNGTTTITSARFLGTGIPAGAPISVAFAGEDLPTTQPVRVTFSLTDAGGPLVLAAGRSGTGAACAPVRATHDGLKLAFADAGSIVYQRLSALPRIRWASSATVISDPVQRLIAFERNAIPADQVVLDAPGPAAAGQPATVSITHDYGDQIAADVEAKGAGYLVVADAMRQPGWSVEIDGKPADLVAADHAMVAVAVPAGVHHVSFGYRAPGQATGAALSGVAVLLLIGAGIAERRRWFSPKAEPDDEQRRREQVSASSAP